MDGQGKILIKDPFQNQLIWVVRGSILCITRALFRAKGQRGDGARSLSLDCHSLQLSCPFPVRGCLESSGCAQHAFCPGASSYIHLVFGDKFVPHLLLLWD